MRFEGTQAAASLEAAFHQKIEDFTAEQLWAITKLAKHVRLRARNNSAFNNYMNGIFKGASFKMVQKTNHRGETYDGLQIAVKGVVVEQDEED